MNVFLKILGYVSGPIIGAIIGYFTNYLAVKMLFRPYKAKKIGEWTLPFTPGIIPKRQPQLAKAIGKAVGEELFTSEDIKKAVLDEETKEKMTAMIIDSMYQEKTLEGISVSLCGEDKTEALKENIASAVTDKIVTVAREADVGALIAKQGAAIIKEKKSSLGMLALMISDDMIDGLLSQVGEKINDYVEHNGDGIFLPIVQKEINGFAGKELEQILSKEKCAEVISRLFDGAFSSIFDGFLKELDISSVVEAKVNAMDMRDLEKLCMSVMKKELHAVVNLGAVLGFIIGIVNCFI